MKRYLGIITGIMAISAITFLNSCKTKVHHCSGCCDFSEATMTYIFDTANGTQANLTFYKAFTPSNTPYCEYYSGSDSTGTYEGTVWIKDEESCRDNPDEKFSDFINAGYVIGGYNPEDFSQRNLRTRLKITRPDDTTAIWENKREQNYGAGPETFVGEENIRDVGHGIGVSSPFASGLYGFIFYVYDTVQTDVKWGIPEGREVYPSQIKLIDILDNPDSLAIFERKERAGIYLEPGVDSVILESNFVEIIMDSVAGNFCLIRNEVDCPVNGCSGKDDGDPLLK